MTLPSDCQKSPFHFEGSKAESRRLPQRRASEQPPDGMLLYHGSNTEVNKIDLGKCEEGKDFGKGFYLTTSYQQAQHFVPISVKKYNYTHKNTPVTLDDGRVSVYRLHLNDELLAH